MSKEYSGLELKVNLSGFFVSHSVGKRVVGWAIRCFESCARILNIELNSRNETAVSTGGFGRFHFL